MNVYFYDQNGVKQHPPRESNNAWLVPVGAKIMYAEAEDKVAESNFSGKQEFRRPPFAPGEEIVAVKMNLPFLRGQLVFIAGPYRAANGRAVVENIRAAEHAAILLARAGVFFFCPHLNSRNLDGVASDDFWLEQDKRILRDCEAVLGLDGWTDSVGARLEVELAAQLGLPIFKLVISPDAPMAPAVKPLSREDMPAGMEGRAK